MSRIACRPFGHTPDNRPVDCYTLTNARGTHAEIITWGAALRALCLPRAGGEGFDDLVQGFDHMDGYLAHGKYMGAMVGRVAGRIGGGRFTLNGREYTLCLNDGPNHLHGGSQGFDKRLWEAAPHDGALELRYLSPHGEEGYPGNLEVTVTYALDDWDCLEISCQARSDADTIVGLTNHSYFNLDGHGAGGVENHLMQIFASRFAQVDGRCLVTGEISPVEGTPMDFRAPTPIGARMGGDCPQLRNAGGYDHSFIIDRTHGPADAPALAARVCSPASGRSLEVLTTQYALHFYSGNFLDGLTPGKNGASYPARSAFCLETQGLANATAFSHFPSPVLRAGERYAHRTLFRFHHTTHAHGQ